MSGGDRAESWSEYLRRIEKADYRGILLKYNRTVKSTEIQKGWAGKITALEKIIRYKWKVLTGVEAHKNSLRSNLQEEILPQWQSALKWGLGEVQPGSTPSGHTAELPSPVLPWLTQCLPQVINQWFRLWFNSSHTPHNISYVKRHYVHCICLF